MKIKRTNYKKENGRQASTETIEIEEKVTIYDLAREVIHPNIKIGNGPGEVHTHGPRELQPGLYNIRYAADAYGCFTSKCFSVSSQSD